MAPAWRSHTAVFTLAAGNISTLRSMARFVCKYSMYSFYALLLPLNLHHPLHANQREWLDFGWFASHNFNLLVID